MEPLDASLNHTRRPTYWFTVQAKKRSNQERETRKLCWIPLLSTLLPKYIDQVSSGVPVRYFLPHILAHSPGTNPLSSIMAQESPSPTVLWQNYWVNSSGTLCTEKKRMRKIIHCGWCQNPFLGALYHELYDLLSHQPYLQWILDLNSGVHNITGLGLVYYLIVLWKTKKNNQLTKWSVA